MKNKMKLSLIASALFLIGCTVTTPNHPSTSSTLTQEPLKIKKMSPVSYKYQSEGVGCSEIELLQQFVGKQKKAEDGSLMRIDNILEIHSNVSSKHQSFLGLSTTDVYDCTLWGLAVEYEK